ncbi:MAG TPA: hypothetical protein VEV41_14160 [Terriglobales bacterium]|jgi:hypothetical protein|nr:hypothetical protein [Terriglobales bacterium]
MELFGHVSLVEGYNLPKFKGCHALIEVRDEPGKTVAVLTDSGRLQTLLEAALGSGHLVAVDGKKMAHPPCPAGGKWGVDVYSADRIILYKAL